MNLSQTKKRATSKNLYQTGIYLHWFIIQLCNFTKIRGESQALYRKVTFILYAAFCIQVHCANMILRIAIIISYLGQTLFLSFLDGGGDSERNKESVRG